MHLSDSFYVALCMTILVCAVVYWFWTQNQYVLRKLNLLNNIVFEMRTQLNKEEAFPDSFAKPTEYPPAPASVMGDDEDILHEQLSNQVSSEVADIAAATTLEEKLFEPKPVVQPFEEAESIRELAEPLHDLAPGGSLIVNDDVKPTTANVLDTMTLKELRRLAEQRGVSGTASMKKAQLLTALREQKMTVEPLEGTVNLS